MATSRKLRAERIARITTALNIFRGDIYGGITAAVVALPLTIAFGVTSGLGPTAGLYSAIGVGFFAAIFGGTRVQISGPTAPMTVVMAAVITQYGEGNLSYIFTIVFLAGAIQICLSALRIGRYIAYMPYSVVSGFMSGIGVVIIIVQFLPMIGAPVAGGPIETFREIPDALRALFSKEERFNVFTLTCLTLLICIYWPPRLRAWLPAPLAALLVGTFGEHWLYNQQLEFAKLFVGTQAPSGLIHIAEPPRIGAVPSGLPSLYLPVVSLGTLIDLLRPAVLLAVLGSLDSLLTSLIADSATRTRHNSNREIFGQGIGNMAAGLIGGLPGAGATSRTLINVRAGGSTRLSGAAHALALLAIVLGFGELAGRIPLAVLAGILLKVGWDAIDWRYVLRVLHLPRGQVIVMLSTMFITIFVDLVAAVTVGVVIATFVTAEWMEKEEVTNLKIKLLRNGTIAVAALRGSYSHASAREMVSAITANIDKWRVLVFDFTATTHMDTSNIFAVEEVLLIAAEKKKDCVVAVGEMAEEYMNDLKLTDKIDPSHIKSNRATAIRMAGELAAARKKR